MAKRDALAKIADDTKSRRAKASAGRDVAPREIVRPTPEQEGRHKFRSAGMAMRKVPIIEQLFDAGKLREDEYQALAYYRDQASLAESSPVRSCCDNSPRGGNGPGVAITSAILETARIERDLGGLRDIAFAVAVEDVSLPQWCIEKYGGRERYDKRGRFVAMVPVREKESLKLARLELRMASHRIVK